MLSLRVAAMVVTIGAGVAIAATDARSEPRLGTTPTARFQELLKDKAHTYSPIVFSSLPPEPSLPVQPQLINGDPVDPRYFPTVFRTTKGGPCTAELVGEAALLTAAHCVPSSGLIKLTLGTQEIGALCERAPGYNPPVNRSEDWALCLLEFPVVGISYETIDTRVPEPGTSATLMGYGCTREGGPRDGKLRIGLSETVDRETATVTVDGQTVKLPVETSTIYTKSSIGVGGGAILCPGDSGGPLFIVFGNSFNDARSLAGVNSRTTFGFGVSLFAATASVEGRQFFREWSERHGQKICGINSDQNCR